MSYRIQSTLFLALAVGLGQPAVAAAQTLSKTQLQGEVERLQAELNTLKAQLAEQNHQTQATAPSVQESTSSTPVKPAAVAEKQKMSKPKSALTIGGGLVTEYQYQRPDNTGGHLILDYLDLNVRGYYGRHWTYADDERFSTVNIKNHAYLHYGWFAYNFGEKHHRQQIKFGLFHEPFGNLPYGYDSFWGSLAYYAGFTDHQAAGIGYRLEDGPWQVNLAAFKNDNLGQPSTYAGGVATDGYHSDNGGAVRLAYHWRGSTRERHAVFSVAAKGGQLQAGDRQGTRWAVTAAMNGTWGPWNLKLQAVDYAYNVPRNASYGGVILPRSSIIAENYGFAYRMPARGQLYGASLKRSFSVHWGPVHTVSLYDDYGYLHVGTSGGFNDGTVTRPHRVGDVQMNVAGVEFAANPIYVWADVISGRNAAMAFTGPDDGAWHTRFNLAIGAYFDGTIKN
ncbi:MAG: hypothetical protein OWQ56_06980 [Acidithiobacillus caldus]|nr:hypothetical protein [Acidithiobacillus caldus]